MGVLNYMDNVTMASQTGPALDQTDLILVLLAAPTADPRQRSRCEGITRLEKLLFLLEHEADYADFKTEVAEPFAFKPFHYGPYAKEVYDAVEVLKTLRLLRERRIDVSTGLDVGEGDDLADVVFDTDDLTDTADVYVQRQFSLTEDGEAIANLLSTRLSPRGKKILTDLKDRFGRMSLRQLLRYVYSNYDDYTTKSRIRSRVL